MAGTNFGLLHWLVDGMGQIWSMQSATLGRISNGYGMDLFETRAYISDYDTPGGIFDSSIKKAAFSKRKEN